MTARLLAYFLLLVAFVAAQPYGVGQSPIWFALVGFIACALLTVLFVAVRRSRFTIALKWCGLALSAFVLLLWLVSIAAYVRLPFAPRLAWAVGGGNLIRQTGVDFEGKPLALTVRWAWSGVTAGEFGSSSASWGRGRTANATYCAIWPALIALVLPAVILWVGYPKRYPAGSCQKCGYDLTGNVSRICPECGCATESLG
ncbi:MAG: hypothetical protein JSU63_07460 [Phycisphaerales bacterium]|nr:MAG: hypothetical protein JSU63_07460 [Phycisphaerales bacterium]